MAVTDLELVELSGEQLGACAALMMATPPWSILRFAAEACLDGLGAPRVVVVGAMIGGELVGFVAMLAEGIEFEPLIVYLCVTEQWRNRGVGRTLIDHFEQRYADAANLYLFVSDVNPNAQRLYQRLGYCQVGALPNFNLVGQTEFLYRKTRGPLMS